MDKEKQRDALFEYIKSQKLLEFQKFQQQQQLKQQQHNYLQQAYVNKNHLQMPYSNLLVTF